ncbi:MAG: hypothetical protein QNK37_12455 [Acidobacteriota bacterium]|nr:hypothetical protein [Acidobacteriota bacterium]
MISLVLSFLWIPGDFSDSFGSCNDRCNTILYKQGKTQNCDDHSPVVVDLDSDGFNFSGPEGAVQYDLYANGHPLFLQWVMPFEDDAFLALDLNGNGVVDDGSELFGSGTRMIATGDAAPNGYVGLAQYDEIANGGNDDGLITPDDIVWENLFLWLDADADGISTQDEVFALADFQINAFEYIPRESRRRDRHGNKLKFWAAAYRRDLPKLKTVDVFFKEVSIDF